MPGDSLHKLMKKHKFFEKYLFLLDKKSGCAIINVIMKKDYFCNFTFAFTYRFSYRYCGTLK